MANTYKGYVSTEHTIWCGTCSRMEQVSEPTLRLTHEWAKSVGWKRSKAYGWQCPKCVQNEVK